MGMTGPYTETFHLSLSRRNSRLACYCQSPVEFWGLCGIGKDQQLPATVGGAPQGCCVWGMLVLEATTDHTAIFCFPAEECWVDSLGSPGRAHGIEVDRSVPWRTTVSAVWGIVSLLQRYVAFMGLVPSKRGRPASSRWYSHEPRCYCLSTGVLIDLGQALHFPWDSSGSVSSHWFRCQWNLHGLKSVQPAQTSDLTKATSAHSMDGHLLSWVNSHTPPLLHMSGFHAETISFLIVILGVTMDM